MHKYIGWIPTITGRLSFSTVGTGKNPHKEFKYLNALGPRRIIIVAQRRRITDAVFDRLGDFLNFLRKRKGHSVFVFFGESNKESDFSLLTGPCVELTTERFEALRPRLLDFGALRDSEEILDTFAGTAKEFLAEAAVRPGSFCSVEILRDGKTEIQLVEDGRLTKETEKRNASQFFFFLRDITHRHQHHAPSSDTILDVTSADEGQAAWKRETLYSLYRWVIHRKRDQSLDELINCKGVLAYAKSFEHIHSSGKIPKEKRTRAIRIAAAREHPSENFPIFNYETTLASVTSSVEAAREKALKPNAVSVTFTRILPLFATLLALFAPLHQTAVSSNATEQQRLVAGALDWINANILFTVGGLLTISVIYGLSGLVKAKFRVSDVMHDSLRVLLSATSDKRKAVAFLVFVILALIGLFVGAAFLALESNDHSWYGPGKA